MASRGSTSWRDQHWGKACEPKLEKVRIGPRCELKVDRRIIEATEALAAVFAAHKYNVNPPYPEGDSGSYNCRHMRHDPNAPMSNHSWGTALDINWKTNPAGSKLRTDMPPQMIKDIQRIRTKGGAPVWRWGGDWDDDGQSSDHSYIDAMHFEVIATPTELTAGIDWTTVAGHGERKGADMDGLKVIYGQRGSVDRGTADNAAEMFTSDLLFAASSGGAAKAAYDRGATVYVVGGPACREMGAPNERGVFRKDRWVFIWGETGGDTDTLLNQIARSGW